MAAINCSRLDGLGQQSSYSHVFGMEYSLPLLAPIQEIHKAKSVENLDKLLNSANFHQKMVAIGELPVNEENNVGEVDSFSNQLCSETNEEKNVCEDGEDDSVSKQLFLETKDDGNVGGEDDTLAKQLIPQCQDVIILDHTGDATHVLTDVPTATNSVRGRIGIAAEEALRLPNAQKRKILGITNRIVNPRLVCGICEKFAPSPLVTVAEESYYKLNYETNRWWCSDMVATFGILMAHNSHRDDVIYMDCGTPTNAEFVNRANRAQLPSSVRAIIAVAHASSHYAVLHLRLDAEKAIVHDGLHMSVGRWKPHVTYMLARFGISVDKWEILARTTGDYLDGLQVVQRDGFNCGPIACMVLWKLFQPQNVNLLNVPQSDYRRLVVTELRRLLTVCGGNLKVFVKNKVCVGREHVEADITTSQEPDEKRKIEQDWKSAPVEQEHVDATSTGSNRATALTDEKRQANREAADKKRRFVQDQQSRKMRRAHAAAAHVALGEAVVMKVDERDRAHHNPLGIQGIVAGTGRCGTSVRIATSAGVLASKKKAILFAPEQFRILKNPTLPGKLREIQDSVRKGTFDINLQPTTSVANAHKVLYGSGSQGRGRCKCKNGCTKHCGCRRKKIACSSSCMCNANCGNDGTTSNT